MKKLLVVLFVIAAVGLLAYSQRATIASLAALYDVVATGGTSRGVKC